MPEYDKRWETAKTKFENATGVKKPKPNGFFKAFFNYTGLTTALKEADSAIDAAAHAKQEEKAKLVEKAAEKETKLGAAIKDYLGILDREAKNEKADNNAKTKLYRELKILTAELKDIGAKAAQSVDSMKVSMIQGITAKQHAAKIMKTSLASAISSAVLAVKKVQADPKAATFNELFSVSDTPGRKIQVQLLAAAKQLEAGQLPVLREDPKYVADKFAPWQGQTTAKSVLPNTAAARDVQVRLDEFKSLLKLVQDYSNQL